MSGSRRIKILTIVALIIAIASMSLGFAAFSASLNISSSAAVAPNSSDFKMKIYGFDTEDNFADFMSKVFNYSEFDESLLSEDNSFAYTSRDNGATGTIAYIDNSTMSISNMNVTFTDASSQYVQYVFVIKNTGKYTAYLNVLDLEAANSNLVSSCEGLEGTTPALASAACQDLEFKYVAGSSQGVSLDLLDIYIEPDDFILFGFTWEYGVMGNAVLPDGPIKYTIENFHFPFTTAPNAIND